MWKVFLALVGHRIFLLAVALIAVNIATPNVTLKVALTKKVVSLPEAAALEGMLGLTPAQAVKSTVNPFLWLSYGLSKYGHVPPAVALTLLSNLFLCLFLWELYTLMTRMVTPEFAVMGTILAVLWPTSYEMSMGSYFALPCLCAMMAVRQAIDNRWFLSGLALGLLVLTEPWSVALFPLLLYIFWYFQRHFQISQVIKRTAFFLVPACAAMAWRYAIYRDLGGIVHDSAIFNLVASAKSGQGILWTFTHSYLGQTITILFFTIGTVLAFLSNSMVMNRLVPLTMWVALMCFAPYNAVASRALIAGTGLQGIASHTSKPALTLVQVMLLVFGAYEIFAVFS